MALSKEVNFQTLSHVLEEFIPVPRDRNIALVDYGEMLSSNSESDHEDDNVTTLADRYLGEISNENEEEEAGMELSQNSQGDELRQEIEDQLSGECLCRRDCYMKVNVKNVYDHILNLREMSKAEKEMFIMGKLMPKNDVAKTRKGDRMRTQYIFHFGSVQICRKTFIICNDLGEVVLRNIITHMEMYGITSRTHGNVGKLPKHALSFDDTSRVVQFIKGYSEKFGLSQPAAPRGRDNTPPVLLPAGQTKSYVYDRYVECCSRDVEGVRIVGFSSFKDIWLKTLPHVKFINVREDVCSKCELLRRAVADAVTEDEKLSSSNEYSTHLRHAREENEFYKSLISRSKMDDNVGHYTFDFAHHVTLPHHARQMGPMYFLNLRRIQWFGVRREDQKDQLNFLIDESDTPGPDGTSVHGPDAVISMIDNAIYMQGRGEKMLHFHADNCPGQNKNGCVVAYFLWRVMNKFEDEIQLHMQPPGHTKCLIDAGFGLAKQQYRRSDCDRISDLIRVVERSSLSNHALSYSSGHWVWLSWKDMLGEVFTRFKGIRKYHHFRFSKDYPGTVFARNRIDDEEEEFSLLRNAEFRYTGVPQKPLAIQPFGLTFERQKYLFETVRKYVKQYGQDELCPVPVRPVRQHRRSTRNNPDE